MRPILTPLAQADPDWDLIVLSGAHVDCSVASSLRAVLIAGRSDIYDPLRDWVPSVIRTSIDRMNMVGTAAYGVFLDYTEAHAVPSAVAPCRCDGLSHGIGGSDG